MADNATHHQHCLDVFTEPHGDNPSAATILWTLENASNHRELATVTLQQPNETKATTCWNGDFECSFLSPSVTNSNRDEHGRLRVVWNGIVFVDQPYNFHPLVGQSLVWIGDKCHNYRERVCNDIHHESWLLDVEVTLLSNSEDVGSSDGGSIYWRVYTDFGSNNWGNLFRDPYYSRYRRPYTTFRSLHCLDRNFGGCVEFGLASQSEPHIKNLALRVDGKIKKDTWSCNHHLCRQSKENDIVTPLRRCWGISYKAVIGIVLAAAVILVFVSSYILKRRRARVRTNQNDSDVPSPISHTVREIWRRMYMLELSVGSWSLETDGFRGNAYRREEDSFYFDLILALTIRERKKTRPIYLFHVLP